jgi:hypothetical protein
MEPDDQSIEAGRLRAEPETSGDSPLDKDDQDESVPIRGRLFDKATWTKQGAVVDHSDRPKRTEAEIIEDLRRIDDRERLIGLIAGPLGAVVAVILMFHALAINPAVHHKGHIAPSITEAYGIVGVFLGAIVVVAAFLRRRSFLGFTLLFMGISLGIVFAIPFWIVGVWLLFRATRFQKELSELTGQPTRGWLGGSAGSRGTARAGAGGQGARSGASSSRKKPATDHRGPVASKRYTPPKPSRPRPPA